MIWWLSLFKPSVDFDLFFKAELLASRDTAVDPTRGAQQAAAAPPDAAPQLLRPPPTGVGGVGGTTWEQPQLAMGVAGPQAREHEGAVHLRGAGNWQALAGRYGVAGEEDGGGSWFGLCAGVVQLGEAREGAKAASASVHDLLVSLSNHNSGWKSGILIDCVELCRVE